MCHSPVLRHGDGSAVHIVLRDQGDANWAWRECVAPGQAEFEVHGGIKEWAKFVVGEIGGFLTVDNEEVSGVMKSILSVLSGPEPGLSVSVAKSEAGKQIRSPRPGSDSGEPVLDAMRRDIHTR